jgi:hypothetical protein
MNLLRNSYFQTVYIFKADCQLLFLFKIVAIFLKYNQQIVIFFKNNPTTHPTDKTEWHCPQTPWLCQFQKTQRKSCNHVPAQ